MKITNLEGLQIMAVLSQLEGIAQQEGKLRYNLFKNQQILSSAIKNESDMKFHQDEFLKSENIEEGDISEMETEAKKELDQKFKEYIKNSETRKDFLKKEIDVEFHQNTMDELFNNGVTFAQLESVKKYISVE